MKKAYTEDEDTLVTEEILSLEQEKRTALKTIRIGLSMVALQASLFFLALTHAAIYRHILASDWDVPFWILNLLFCGAALLFIIRPLIRIRRWDRKIARLRRRCGGLDCAAPPEAPRTPKPR